MYYLLTVKTTEELPDFEFSFMNKTTAAGKGEDFLKNGLIELDYLGVVYIFHNSRVLHCVITKVKE